MRDLTRFADGSFERLERFNWPGARDSRTDIKLGSESPLQCLNDKIMIMY